MILMTITSTVPPFVGLDGKVWRLRKGDLVSVNPGLSFRQAKILVTKGAAFWTVQNHRSEV